MRLRYCVFDLLYLDDKDLRSHPLIERKEMLEKILPATPLLQYSTHVWEKGIAAFKRAARAGEEGVMAKLATRPLLLRPAHARMAEGQSLARPGGGHCWLHRAPAVAAIFRLARACTARGQRLALCRPRRHRLRPGVAQIPARLARAAHHQSKPVAEKVPDEANTTWVKPKLVGEVKFTEWTSKGEMRHPVFLGLRTDKKATDVIREIPKPGAGPAH